MIQFVLETSGFQTSQSLFGDMTLVVLISDRDPIWSCYYTLISGKTQASFAVFGECRAGFNDFWVETPPLVSVDQHDKQPAAFSNLRCCQPYAFLMLHEHGHVLGQGVVLQRPGKFHWFGPVRQDSFGQLHSNI
jgi:hypothetical protein